MLMAVVMAGCGGAGDLPDSFGVEAEIVSVEPGPGLPATAAGACTPTMVDIADGPDWILEFSNINGPDAPSFAERPDSANPDSAARCQQHGGVDCCSAVVATDGGRSLSCRGSDTSFDLQGVDNYMFTFNADGTGSSTTTRINKNTGRTVCVARTAWSSIIPL